VLPPEYLIISEIAIVKPESTEFYLTDATINTLGMTSGCSHARWHTGFNTKETRFHHPLCEEN